MMEQLGKIRADFDRIARLTADDADRIAPYGGFLLRQIPSSCKRILEVGCGTGALCRALATRGHQVVGIDLAPEMIRIARERTPQTLGVTYHCGDFLESTAGEKEEYDGVVSVATLHHLPLETTVERMAGLVRPGGVLVIHDVRSDAGAKERLLSVVATIARFGSRVRAGQWRTRAEVKAAWQEHGQGERYPTMAEVEAWSRRLVPGARVYRHLQWRYSVIWRRSDAVNMV